MPSGVSPERCLVLAGCTLAVDFVLHHGNAVELGAAPEREGGRAGTWMEKTVTGQSRGRDEDNHNSHVLQVAFS